MIFIIHSFLWWFVDSADDAHILVKILLDQFIKREECPAELLKDSTKPPSFLYGISAAIAGV